MNEILDKIGRLVRDPSIEVDMVGFAFALIVSAIVSLGVSALYQVFYERRATGSQIHRSFLLLGPSITALFIAVQFSLPLSLGLLGALSIVRFRTPVKEPEEIGFIMLLIASAVVTATFQFLLLGILLAIAVVFLLLRRYVPGLTDGKRLDGMLLLIVDGEASGTVQEGLVKALDKRFERGQLQGLAHAEGLTTLHYAFTNVARERLDGLQGELATIAPVRKVSIFFNGEGALR